MHSADAKIKAAKLEHQGLHDPSFGLLERPGLDSGLGFQCSQKMVEWRLGQDIGWLARWLAGWLAG